MELNIEYIGSTQDAFGSVKKFYSVRPLDDSLDLVLVEKHFWENCTTLGGHTPGRYLTSDFVVREEYPGSTSLIVIEYGIIIDG